jgi:hypothetical protein
MHWCCQVNTAEETARENAQENGRRMNTDTWSIFPENRMPSLLCGGVYAQPRRAVAEEVAAGRCGGGGKTVPAGGQKTLKSENDEPFFVAFVVKSTTKFVTNFHPSAIVGLDDRHQAAAATRRLLMMRSAPGGIQRAG